MCEIHYHAFQKQVKHNYVGIYNDEDIHTQQNRPFQIQLQHCKTCRIERRPYLCKIV